MRAGKRKYKPYPKYKNSGVEWLGWVPEHWDVMPLWAVADCNREKLRDDEEPDTEIDYVDISAVTYEGGILSSQSMLFGNAPSRARRRAAKGDIAISTVRTYLKAVAEVTEKFSHCVFSTGFAIVHPKQQIHQPFLRWIIPSGSFVSAVESHSEGVSYPAINAADLMKLKVVLPLSSDCQIIADFIERECGRMDKLVEKKQEFIALLKEKRQALITHAVTKGLDPKAAMKDSGVEWLGKVPKHWEVLPLRRLARVQTGGTPSGADEVYFEDGGFNWYTPADFSENLVLGSASRALSQTGKENVRIFPAMSILLVGIGATIGKVGVSLKECSSNQQINAIMCEPKAHPFYLAYALRNIQDYILKCGKFTTLPIINQDDTKALLFPTPPVDEQIAISDHIDRETTRIDRLLAKTIESIDLLKERKTALITAAVTGQIDVSQSA